jgi:hypothetical protein
MSNDLATLALRAMTNFIGNKQIKKSKLIGHWSLPEQGFRSEAKESHWSL